ncbi:MAG: glycosyltransferase family 4 protein [Methanobacterium sp.]|nr:glycosyltransferase family 4 protein [Methanobacterium sp.]
MKICFIVISNGWGGGENIVHQLTSSLIKKNINVSIILNNEIKKYFADLDVEIINLGSLFNSKCLYKMILNPEVTSNSPHQKPIMILNLLLMFIYFFRVKNRINDYLNHNKIDIIHSHIEYSDILSYIVKNANENLKWLINMHGPWFSLFYHKSPLSSVSNFLITKFLKMAFKKINKIVFVSEYLYSESEKIFGHVIKDKGVVIHNGINISSINGVKSIELKKGFNILFPGGPKLIKGGDILIESVKRLVNEIPDLNLYIALDVPENHLIRQMVKNYNLENHVNFVGFLNKKKYMAFLNSVDILVMPSRMESFGIVYLEAMALGIPVIASDVGGIPEIIKNQRNGILTSLDPDDVSNAILTLYNDHEKRKNISINNLNDAHKFEWANLVKKYVKLYSQLID